MHSFYRSLIMLMVVLSSIAGHSAHALQLPSANLQPNRSRVPLSEGGIFPILPVLERTGEFGGAIWHVASDTTFAYISEGARLTVVDLSDPARPSRRGSRLLSGSIIDIQIRAPYAYVALAEIANSGLGSLIILDIHDPDNPTIVGGLTTTQPNALQVANGFAYLGTDTEMDILDVRKPVSPQRVSRYPARVRDLEVQDGIAYLAGGTSEIVDVRDPANPRRIVTYAPLESTGIEVVGTRAYITSLEIVPGNTTSASQAETPNVPPGPLRRPFLWIFSIAQPDTPTELSKLEGIYPPFQVIGDRLYSFYGTTLRIVDVHDPSKPALMAQELSLFNPNDLQIQGAHAYIADGLAGLRVIDINNDVLSEVGRFNSWGYITDVHVEGTYAYLSASGDSGPNGPISGSTIHGLHIIDISDTTAPTIVGSLDTRRYALSIDIKDQRAYLNTEDYFSNPPYRYRHMDIVDVHDPKNPRLLSSLPGITYLDAQGNVMYTLANFQQELHILDISVPEKPTLLRSIPLDTPGRHGKVVSDILYLTSANQLLIYDVRDPTGPVLLGQLPIGDSSNLAVKGSMIYIVTNNNVARPSFAIIDVSNPREPAFLGRVPLHGTSFASIAIAGNHAFIQGLWGVEIIDISNPRSPSWKGQDASVLVRSLHARENLLYAATITQGMQIFRIAEVALREGVFFPLLHR